MKEFKIKSKYIEFPELFKHDLDAITTKGYAVKSVTKNTLILEKLEDGYKSYNFLINENNKIIKEHLKSNSLSYVELNVYRRDFRPLGISWNVVEPANSNYSNYLLIKSENKKKTIPFYEENLYNHHDESSKKHGILSIIYGAFLSSVFLLQSRVVNNLSIYGYYILSVILIGLFITHFYKFLRHNELKKAMK